MRENQKWAQNLQKICFGYEHFHQKIVSIPFIGQNSKFSRTYVVGTLNLCLETPDTMEKESTRSKHYTQKKVQNVVGFCCVEISPKF